MLPQWQAELNAPFPSYKFLVHITCMVLDAIIMGTQDTISDMGTSITVGAYFTSSHPPWVTKCNSLPLNRQVLTLICSNLASSVCSNSRLDTSPILEFQLRLWSQRGRYRHKLQCYSYNHCTKIVHFHNKQAHCLLQMWQHSSNGAQNIQTKLHETKSEDKIENTSCISWNWQVVPLYP